MWPILIGSAVLSVCAFVVTRARRDDLPPTEDDEDDTDEEDDADDTEEETEPAPRKREPDDDPYDDADVYYNVDAAKVRARKARVPKIKE